MRELLNGILKFQGSLTQEALGQFAGLALGARPDYIYIGCGDSRVDPRVFASLNPGDAFVNRNPGNFVPDCDENGFVSVTEGAATIDLGLVRAHPPISHIIVCGHTNCAAMIDILARKETARAPAWNAWLKNGTAARLKYEQGLRFNPEFADHNQLAMINVIEQLGRLRKHPVIRERLAQGVLQLHGWLFDIAVASVLAYDESSRMFVPINKAYVEQVERNQQPQPSR